MSSQPHFHNRIAKLTERLAETRHRISDLDQRILRQQRRIEKVLTVGVGSTHDLRVQLADLIQARALMPAQMERLQVELAEAEKLGSERRRVEKSAQPPRSKHLRENTEDLVQQFCAELALIEQVSVGIVRHLEAALGGRSLKRRVSAARGPTQRHSDAGNSRQDQGQYEDARRD